MAGLRHFLEGDIQRVADLVWKYLHERKGSAPPSLKLYLNELFLHNPWVEEDSKSLVYEDSQGRIVGFFGILPRRMILQGNPIRMAFGSNFVVDPESRVSMAAIQLVRNFMKGTQDISITDSANESSRQLLRSLGFSVVPTYSLIWARPLRVTRYGLQGSVRLKKSSALAKIGILAGPFCDMADFFAARLAVSPFHQKAVDTTGEELDTETLLQCLISIPSKHFLLPEYDHDSLQWVISFVDKSGAFGKLRKVLVRDTDHKIIGWYIYGVKPGSIGEVLQIGAESASAGKVLDNLFFDAWEHKLIGLHGRLEPLFMDELARRGCFFVRTGSWMLIHSKKPELLNVIQSGTAFFSRLDGEWSLRYSPIES